MSNIERISAIGDIGRSFKVTETVNAIVKPKGFVTWCQLPYPLPNPDHPKGCPNFGIKEGCPPNVEYFLDIYKPQVRVAVLTFDWESYLKWKRQKHPDWTERAVRNPRHFQGHLDANLEDFTDKAAESLGLTPEYTPEAMGVNITLTCLRAGIRLEWPPKKIMHRIAILAQLIK